MDQPLMIFLIIQKEGMRGIDQPLMIFLILHREGKTEVKRE